MKKIVTLLILFVLVINVFSQEEEYYDPSFKIDTTNNQKLKNKTKVSISTGAFVSSYGNKSNIAGTWVAPRVLMPVNNKFAIETGISFSQNNFNNYNPYLFYGDNNSSFSGNLSVASYYIKGYYKFNENLTITGATYKSKVIRTKPVNPGQNIDIDNTGYSFGLNYKFKNGTELNFQMNFNNGAMPYYNTPFSGSSFGYSPFGNTFGQGF